MCVLCVVCCVWCASDNELGAEGGAAVAEAIKNCKQLSNVNLQCMYLVWLCVAVCGLGWWYSSVAGFHAVVVACLSVVCECECVHNVLCMCVDLCVGGCVCVFVVGWMLRVCAVCIRQQVGS